MFDAVIVNENLDESTSALEKILQNILDDCHVDMATGCSKNERVLRKLLQPHA